MTNRILDFSELPARLRVRHRQLVVERPEQPEVSMPMADLAVVVVSHPQVTYTQAVLSGLAQAGGTFVACNRKMLPVGMLLPLAAHHAQVQRFAAQAVEAQGSGEKQNSEENDQGETGMTTGEMTKPQ